MVNFYYVQEITEKNTVQISENTLIGSTGN